MVEVADGSESGVFVVQCDACCGATCRFGSVVFGADYDGVWVVGVLTEECADVLYR